MGIKDLGPLLRKVCPEQLVQYHLSELQGYRVAIDVSIYLYTYIRSAGEKEWLGPFINMLSVFKKHKIKAIFIFDGPNPPIEKQIEQQSRRGNREKLEEKMKVCIEMRDLLYDQYLPSHREGKPADSVRAAQYLPNDLDIPDKLIDDFRLLLEPRRPKKNIRGKVVETVNYLDVEDIIRAFNLMIDKLEKQSTPISNEIHGGLAKEIIKYLGFNYFQATGEAETLCCYLCITGHVDAVISQDTDVLAYATPLFFWKFDVRSETVMVIQYPYLIESLGLTQEEFTDLCILLGCDYNERAKIYTKTGKSVGVGMAKVLPLIQEHGIIDNFEHLLVDVTPLKHERCRELFTIPDMVPTLDVLDIKSDKPDFDKIHDFFRRHKVKMNIKYIKNLWSPSQIIIL